MGSGWEEEVVVVPGVGVEAEEGVGAGGGSIVDDRNQGRRLYAIGRCLMVLRVVVVRLVWSREAG